MNEYSGEIVFVGSPSCEISITINMYLGIKMILV